MNQSKRIEQLENLVSDFVVQITRLEQRILMLESYQCCDPNKVSPPYWDIDNTGSPMPEYPYRVICTNGSN